MLWRCCKLHNDLSHYLVMIFYITESHLHWNFLSLLRDAPDILTFPEWSESKSVNIIVILKYTDIFQFQTWDIELTLVTNGCPGNLVTSLLVVDNRELELRGILWGVLLIMSRGQSPNFEGSTLVALGYQMEHSCILYWNVKKEGTFLSILINFTQNTKKPAHSCK